MSYADSTAYRLVYDTSATDARLTAYLAKASRKIDAALSTYGAAYPADASQEIAAAFSDVCIDMTHRVLGDSAGADGLPDGITQYSQSQGGFTESFSWASPYTDLAVRDDELKWLLSLLGFDTAGVGTCRFWGGGSE